MIPGQLFSIWKRSSHNYLHKQLNMGGCKIKYKKKKFKTSGRKYRETYNLGIRKKYFNQVTQSTNYK